MSDRWAKIAATTALIICVALPWLVGSYLMQVASLALVNSIVAIGLTILIGQAGQVSLASPSFVAIGAYLSIYLMKDVGLTYWLALPLAGLGAAFFGGLLSFPALRVRGLYLAIVTLAFLQITTIIIETLPDITGGVRGISAPRPRLFGMRLTDTHFYYVIVAVTAVMYLMARNLKRSPLGRSFRVLHAGEGVAATLGTDVARAKITAFIISSFYAGIAGALFAPLIGFIDPLEFGLVQSVHHIVFIVVGGLGSVSGAVIGTIVVSVMGEFLGELKEYRELVFNLLLLVVLFAAPAGVAGLIERLPRLLKRQRSGQDAAP